MLPDVNPKSGQSEMVTWLRRPPEEHHPRRAAVVIVTHEKWGEWLFEVYVVAPGVAIGFKVTPAFDLYTGSTITAAGVASGRAHEELIEWPTDVAPLTARVLRKFPLGEIEDAAIRCYRDEIAGRAAEDREYPDDPGYDPEPLRRLNEALAVEGRGRGRSASDYAVLAHVYLHAVARESRSPVKDTAAVLVVSPKRVANMLNDARTRGILTPPPVPGRPGGALTDYGKQLLDEILGEDER